MCIVSQTSDFVIEYSRIFYIFSYANLSVFVLYCVISVYSNDDYLVRFCSDRASWTWDPLSQHPEVQRRGTGMDRVKKSKDWTESNPGFARAHISTDRFRRRFDAVPVPSTSLQK